MKRVKILKQEEQKISLRATNKCCQLAESFNIIKHFLQWHRNNRRYASSHNVFDYLKQIKETHEYIQRKSRMKET